MDNDENVRLCCLKTTIDLYNPGKYTVIEGQDKITVDELVKAAQKLYDFVKGDPK